MTESGQQLTLLAEHLRVVQDERSLDQAYQVYQIKDQDRLALADLYSAVYPKDIVADVTAARDEIEQTFAGAYGQLDMAASSVLWYNNVIVGAVMTVEAAPWFDIPPGPFVIEVMVHPAHQRLGLATYLMQWISHDLIARGKRTMALRVMSDNAGARALYSKLGFTSWPS